MENFKIKFNHQKETMSEVLGVPMDRMADIYQGALDHFPGEQPLIKDSKILEVCVKLARNPQEVVAIVYYVSGLQQRLAEEFGTEEQEN